MSECFYSLIKSNLLHSWENQCFDWIIFVNNSLESLAKTGTLLPPTGIMMQFQTQAEWCKQCSPLLSDCYVLLKKIHGADWLLYNLKHIPVNVNNKHLVEDNFKLPIRPCTMQREFLPLSNPVNSAARRILVPLKKKKRERWKGWVMTNQ